MQQRGGAPNEQQRPPSLSNYSIYPPPPPSQQQIEQRFPGSHLAQERDGEMHHASPRIVGTPMSSNSTALAKTKQPQGTPTGPEKPQRQYSYHEEQQQLQRHQGEKSSKTSTTSRVRFQDDSNDDDANKVGESNGTDEIVTGLI